MKKIFQPAGSQRITSLVSTLAAALMISGCVGGQKVAAPYIPGTSNAGGIQQTDTANQSKTYKRQVVTPAVTRVNDRISSYEQRLQEWQDIDEGQPYMRLSPEQESEVRRCQEQVVEILSGYRQLHVALLRTQARDVSRRLLNTRLPEIQNLDIHYIEGQCSDLLVSLQSSSADTVKAQESLAESMSSLLAAGEYQEAIRKYDSLQLSSGETPGFEVTYYYGLALLKAKRQYEARRILNDLYIRSSDLNQDKQSRLLKLLADLNFGLGDYATAKKRYLELLRVNGVEGPGTDWPRSQLKALDYSYAHTGEVREYASLLKNFLAYDPVRDGFTVAEQSHDFLRKHPQSELIKGVRELAGKSDRAAEQWFADVLSEVDRLNSEQKSQQALGLIDSISPRLLPPDKQAILQLKRRSLGSTGQTWTSQDNGIQEEILEVPRQDNQDAQAAAPVTPVSPAGEGVVDDGLQRTWDQALKDMQAKNYDQSIELFSGLLNTSYAARANERIREASLLAAQEKRKEAAALFVRASRATDTARRRQLLMSSRNLLEEILQKYPRSGLAGKVRRNLNRIDQELAGIDQTI